MVKKFVGVSPICVTIERINYGALNNKPIHLSEF